MESRYSREKSELEDTQGAQMQEIYSRQNALAEQIHFGTVHAMADWQKVEDELEDELVTSPRFSDSL